MLFVCTNGCPSVKKPVYDMGTRDRGHNEIDNGDLDDDLGDDDGVGGVGRARYAQHHRGKCLIGLA